MNPRPRVSNFFNLLPEYKNNYWALWYSIPCHNGTLQERKLIVMRDWSTWKKDEAVCLIS
jgi:hypothetical protein